MTYPLTTVIRRVKFAREAGAVRRVHVHKVLGEYDIAQHVYGALCLLRALNPTASLPLVWAVLSHDKPERLTGDIPSPAKYHGLWFDPERYAEHEAQILGEVGWGWDALTPIEARWLQAVDALEFYLFCLDQEALGNRTLGKPKQNIMGYVESGIERGSWPEEAVNFYFEARSCEWIMCDELGGQSGTQQL